MAQITIHNKMHKWIAMHDKMNDYTIIKMNANYCIGKKQ